MSNWFVQSPNNTRSCRRNSEWIGLDDFSASSMLAINGRRLCLVGLFKVPMIRDLAEETVDGSAFDDFSASSMLAINGRRLCLIGLFKIPMIRDLAEERVDGSASVLLQCWQ